MTSRARRLALAMYGHRRERALDKAIERTTPAQWDRITSACGVMPAPCSCYEAMDDVDGLLEVPDTRWADSFGQPARLLIGGNFGLPCA